MFDSIEGHLPAEARVDADLLKELLNCVGDGVCLLDRDNHVLYWNRAAERITGYLAQEVSGRHCSDHLELCADCEGAALVDGECPLSKVKQDGHPRENIVYLRHRQGHRIPVRMRAHAILDTKGEIAGVAEVFTPASAQGRTELAEAARHGGHDALTGAVNREYGEMRLSQELNIGRRFGIATAWMRVDVDGIEKLLQRFGHGMVESALRMIAHTIDANLNSLDALVRWDAYSFRVMVRHAVEGKLHELGRKLAMLVSTSQVEWWGEGRDVSVSIAGVMAYDEDTVESLERRVDAAMKLPGKG
jgi:diguanylate cyclase (GGDEF)-like protein/PAS domain S-box-containing protein